MVITWWAAALVVAATVIWIALAIAVFSRSAEAPRAQACERALLGATLFVALLWTALAPPWNLGATGRTQGGDKPSNCFRIRESMRADEVAGLMKSVPRIVSEEDTRGPKASAWVYDDQRCIVHLLDARVVSIEQ
jgi:hypothetical protein